MAKILYPKYKIDKIENNFFQKNYGPIDNFINENFTLNQSNDRYNPERQTSQETRDVVKICNSIINLVKNPIFFGFDSIDLIYQNVLNDTNISENIFGKQIIYNFSGKFIDLSNDEANTVIIKNLSMDQIIIGINSLEKQKLLEIIDTIVKDIKTKTYDRNVFYKSVLYYSKIVCKQYLNLVIK